MVELSQIDLGTLIEADGVILRGRPDGERHGPCPKCGGTDRFRVHRHKGKDWYACRQCHETPGDAIAYLRWLHGLTFPEALASLGIADNTPLTTTRPLRCAQPVDALGKPMPARLDDPPSASWQTGARGFAQTCEARLWSPNGARALSYLRDKRQLTDETLTAFGIGYNDADRWLTWGGKRVFAARGLTIPTDYAGSLWRVNIRRPVGAPKYQAVTGSRVQLFNGDALADASVDAVICAGEFDAMLAQQLAPAGVAAVTFGSESKTPTWEARYLLRSRRVLIIFDTDATGEAGARRWREYVPWAEIVTPTAHDLTDMARKGDQIGAWLAVQLAGDDESRNLARLGDVLGYTVTFSDDGRRVTMRRASMPIPASEALP